MLCDTVYDLLISDLHAERRRSIVYDNYFSSQFRNVIGGDNAAVSTSDDNDATDGNNDSGTL